MRDDQSGKFKVGPKFKVVWKEKFSDLNDFDKQVFMFEAKQAANNIANQYERWPDYLMAIAISLHDRARNMGGAI